MSTKTHSPPGAETLGGSGRADDAESAGLRETAGLRGSGSPPDYFGRPDARQRDQMAGAGDEGLAQAQQFGQGSQAPAPGRLSPFQALNQMRTQMDRLLADLTGLPGLLGGVPSAMELLPAVWSPPVDISETDDAWIIEAEVPGAKPEDIVIEVRDHQLVIRGEVKEGGGEARQRSRRIGRFDYRVTVPAEIDAEKIEATLDNGVLRLQLPKREVSSRRRIPIAA